MYDVGTKYNTQHKGGWCWCLVCNADDDDESDTFSSLDITKLSRYCYLASIYIPRYI